MEYKIYYDEISDITSNGAKKCGSWITGIDAVQKKVNRIIESSVISGRGSDSIKQYLAHYTSTLSVVLKLICRSYYDQAVSYYQGYISSVDSGDGSKFGCRYTTIASREVAYFGTAEKGLNDLNNKAQAIASDAERVKNRISDIVCIYDKPQIDNFQSQLNHLLRQLRTINSRVTGYENLRRNDFAEIDKLINNAEQLLRSQLGLSRKKITAYTPSDFLNMCDCEDLVNNINGVNTLINKIESNPDFENAVYLAENRDELIKAEEQKSREGVKWLAVGVAVIGAVVVTVVTAGTGSILVGALVGGAVGGITSFTSAYADAYYEDGDVSGEDWSKIGKSTVRGIAEGVVDGVISVGAVGSVVKTPFKKGMESVGKLALKEAAGTVTDTIWDVGEAAIGGKLDGDKIFSIVGSNTTQMTKKIVVEGGAEFLSTFVSADISINSTGTEKYMEKVGNSVVGNLTKSASETVLETGWNLTESFISDPNFGYDTVLSEIANNGKKFLSSAGGDIVNGFVSAGGERFGDFLTDDVSDEAKKKVIETANKSIFDAGESVAENITEEAVTSAVDPNHEFKLDGDFWRKTTKDAVTSLGNDIAEGAMENKKFNTYIKKRADENGIVEVVYIDKDTKVLKEDYDAAIELAGKGSYKNKTAAEILGLKKDRDISNISVKKIQYARIQKSDAKSDTKTDVTALQMTNGKRVNDNGEQVSTKKQFKESIYAKESKTYNETGLRSGTDWDTFAGKTAVKKDDNIANDYKVGFDSTKPIEKDFTLKKGTTISRYGSKGGSTATDKGTDYDSLSMPYERETVEYHEFEVIKDIEGCSKGFAAPNFDSKGGGVQYNLEKNFSYYLRNGYIREKRA